MNVQGRFSRFLWTACLFFQAGTTTAQTFADSVAMRYKFIKPELNNVENDFVGLSTFYEHLYQLETKNIKKVNVVHIGDSHIQADFFSGMLRQKLHSEFGNAGRGLIFPYKVARTNEPYSYQTSTNVAWESKRNIFVDNPLPIGIGGITIKTTDSSAWIKLNVVDQGGLDYSFNKLSVFHDKGTSAFDLMVHEGDNRDNGIIGFINSNLYTQGKFLSTVYLDKLRRNVLLKMYKRDSTQKYAQLYGIVLENDEPGILYNTTGVNGAECRHCNASKYFYEQLHSLDPSLVIISLGTNEAFSRGFNKERFNTEIDSMVRGITRLNPNASVLFTTPGDSYRRKHKNPDMKVARNTIIEYCKANGLAYWDLYEIMGGLGSMIKWKIAGLGSPDKVHFLRSGYELQGKLLHSAITNGYKHFKELRRQ